MTNVGVEITGPYDEDGNGPSSSTVKLWNTESSRAESSAELDPASVIGQSSDDTILAGFTGDEEFNFSGTATGNRLSGSNGLPNDEIKALSRFAKRLESLVTDGQGIGYELIDNQRNSTLFPTPGENGAGMLVMDISWTRKKAQPFQLEWNISGQRSKGVGTTTDNRDEYISKQVSSKEYIPYPRSLNVGQQRGEIISGDGGKVFDLGTIVEKKFERSVEINFNKIAFGNEGDNIGIPVQSPQDNIFIEGVISPKHLLHTYSSIEEARDRLDEFARYPPNNWVGLNAEARYSDSFTNRTFKGQIESFSTTWESGTDIKLQYSLDFIVGDTI